MATQIDGQSITLNDLCLFHTVRGNIVKQYENQKRYHPEERRHALCENDTMITLPPVKTFSPTDSIESYIAFRFFPVALASASFYQGRYFYDRIVTLWQPDKELALRINVSVESRMRCHHGRPSLGDQLDVPEDPDHPRYPLREAISTLKRSLETEIQEVLSKEAEKSRMLREKNARKERGVARSALEEKPIDWLERIASLERQAAEEQHRSKPSKVAKSAVSEAPTDDTDLPARERSKDDEWEVVEVEEEDKSLNMESMEIKDE